MNTNNTPALGSELMRLLQAEVDARTPFGVDFRNAVNAGDVTEIVRLTDEFAIEVVRQYRAKTR